MRPNWIRLQALTLTVLFLCVLIPQHAVASVWVSAPKPKFPTAALSRGSEGYVLIRAYINPNGTVTRAAISRSAGDSALDEAARAAVLKWKMNPAAVKPEYLSQGFEQRIDFRQEAPVGARYREREAYFGSFESAKIFIHAPFPEYPYHERLVRTEGVVLVKMIIGPDGQVGSAELARSSGNANLDNAAVAAVRRWRAHKQYAGRCYILPVTFKLNPYHGQRRVRRF